jgi:ATP-dependent helicase/nuclease subunit A
VEEGSEGVRIMTVHRAKGLEFPVVILADIGANATAQNPDRYIESERGLCAVWLTGWSPWDLLDHETEETARDLLVVPAVGDDPLANNWEAAPKSWIAPVQQAVYPSAERRRAPAHAPACPPFGEDSVLERPDRESPGRDNVQPGLHVLGAAGAESYPVVW